MRRQKLIHPYYQFLIRFPTTSFSTSSLVKFRHFEFIILITDSILNPIKGSLRECVLCIRSFIHLSLHPGRVHLCIYVRTPSVLITGISRARLSAQIKKKSLQSAYIFRTDVTSIASRDLPSLTKRRILPV